MREETTMELASFRLQQARECLQDAEKALASNSFKNSANRSYYCILHAMRAVLALEKFDSKKHSGVIAVFREKYVKTGIFPMKFSDFIGKAFVVRSDSDYKDFYVISKSEVETQIANAKEFLAAVEDYIGREGEV